MPGRSWSKSGSREHLVELNYALILHFLTLDACHCNLFIHCCLMHHSPLTPQFKVVQHYGLEILIFACSHNKCFWYWWGMGTLPCKHQRYERHIVTGDLGIPQNKRIVKL